ncbi:VanW family protein [Paenibacillus aestuarii]|uniref:VanW family protein n=1 Tax=Paenibacillus aestuarii TaxID=516965 RepID=A0ABW0K6W6_9BACL|nr:VanW family protein [Paenibacillus aestuarii]
MSHTPSFGSLSRKHLLALALVASLAGASCGALYIYGSGDKLPAQFQVAGWQAGGLTHAQFQEQFDHQLKQYASLPVHLVSSHPDVASKDLTLSQLGLVVQRGALDQAMQRLFQGTLTERIEARWSLRHAKISLPLTIDPDKLNAAVRQSWKELYAIQPLGARRIVDPNDSIRYEPERSVLRFDTITLNKELSAKLPSFTDKPPASQPLNVTLPFYTEAPAVTVESLQKQGVDRKIIEFTTSFPLSGSGRIHNIRSTATTIQDMLLAPGDIFDYSKIIEQTEAKFGYQEAPVILNGKLVPGVGGGICQVSSTLYNAVLRSGLEIVERRNHSLPVSYVPLGQDATFANGYINFKFRNNMGAYLLIRAVTTDNNVTVKLYGHMPPSDSYDIESKVIETIQPTIQYVHNPNIKRGATKLISKGKEGYVVETYRYKKVNGSVVSKELISKDRYAPVPALFASNRADDQPEDNNPNKNQAPILEDGVKGPNSR